MKKNVGRKFLTTQDADWVPYRLPNGFCLVGGIILRRLPGDGKHQHVKAPLPDFPRSS